MLGLRQHHIGFCTNEINKKHCQWLKIGAIEIETSTADTTQGVCCSLVQLSLDTKIELVAPISGNNHPLESWLSKNNTMYHICFETEDLDNTLSTICDTGMAKIVCSPVHSQIFKTNIAFVMLRTGMLLEFIQLDGSLTASQKT